MTDLGTLPGSLLSGATFINSKSQVVGLAFPCDFSAATAFLWEDGSMVDLNSLIPSESPIYLFSASFIDERGQIAAFGSLANGDMHAVLLIPCDEEHRNVEGCDYSLVDAAEGARRPVAAPHTHRLPNAVLRKLATPRFGIRRP